MVKKDYTPGQENPPGQFNIELPEDVAEGIYSNLAIITHSNAEFVLDFARVMPNVPKGKVKSRLVMTPQHAKRLLKALQDNLYKYESVHGVIEDIEPGKATLMNADPPTKTSTKN